MEEEKSHIRAILIVLVVIFFGGLFLGYYFWGYHGVQHPDYKDMLKQTITYITTIEEKNQELNGKLSMLENDMIALKKQQGIPDDVQVTRLNERVSVLEKENADLKLQVDQKQALDQENQQLRMKVQALVEQMNTSKPGKMQISPPAQLPPPQPAVP